MEIVKTSKEIQDIVLKHKANGEQLGFVPTMGALHEGHLSLIKQSRQSCDLTFCSIFVNPTQFNDNEDFEKYPRTVEADLELLELAGCNYAFVPSVEEIYPEQKPHQLKIDHLTNVMEGKFRPGHFDGVVQVVSRLFELLPVHKAFFGQKDFQQLAIIQEMVKQLNMDIDIVSCPIVREESGLAMSSRNERLTTQERAEASIIYQTLKEIKANYKEHSVQEWQEKVRQTISQTEYCRLEYIEMVDSKSLQAISNWNDGQEIAICIAVFCGNVRLIDNIVFTLQL